MEQNDDIVSANFAEMSRALSAAEPQLIQDFLYSLFTPSEADEIAKRWALVKEIARGTPQREIARALGLSLCKITRGSRELKKEGSSFRRMLALAGFDLAEATASLPARRRSRESGRSRAMVQPLPASARSDGFSKAAQA
ncbi:MAG TPA: Trp family transcriptional regulator [Rectinemataceae bacterium]|nr:Trp family transcriptional regulator [Rectinemataceae bacterium]